MTASLTYLSYRLHYGFHDGKCRSDPYRSPLTLSCPLVSLGLSATISYHCLGKSVYAGSNFVILIVSMISSPTFPSTCLSPDQPGYGQVVSNGTGRRRARRNTQPVAPIASAAAREHKTSWTVVTGAPAANSSAAHYGQSTAPLYPAPQMYPPPDAHISGTQSLSVLTLSGAFFLATPQAFCFVW
jgi:hypothetical protein